MSLDPQKRKRRTRAEIDELMYLLYEVVKDNRPMTVRQVFYQAVSRGYIRKSERDYKNVVVRLLGRMRISKAIPFGWIADNTRWQRKPVTYESMESAVKRTAEFYRRALWSNQSVYVEVWLEKDALAGVIQAETAEYDVPLMVTRGYPSLSYLYEAAEYINELEKPAYLYYLGDLDPSGVDISRNVEERIREFAPDAEIHFERIAVNPWQVEKWNLPTRPTKKTDSRSSSFAGESVEVDAIPPGQLRELVRRSIEQHIDEHALKTVLEAERSERLILREWAKRMAS